MSQGFLLITWILAGCWVKGFPLQIPENEDLCPHITDCQCRRDIEGNQSRGLDVDCEKFNKTILDSMNTENVTKLRLAFGSDENSKHVLGQLRGRMQNLRQLELFSCDLDEFQWKWLPDKQFETLSFGSNGLSKINHGDNSGTNCTHLKKIFSKFEKLYIRDENIQSIPDCLPDSTRMLSISNCKLSSHNATEISWPKSLTTLRLAMNPPNMLPASFFMGIPLYLKIFWISHIPMSNGEIPVLPKGVGFKNFLIQRSNIINLSKDTFENISSIKLLNLAGNHLTKLPSRLPRNITILQVYDNEIGFIEDNLWANITSLKRISLNGNKLVTVPLGLPASLTYIDLSKNSIAYCDPSAFSHMKHLQHLYLARNKLQLMPVNIVPGIESFDISKNLISAVPGPVAYDFCINCSFEFNNNPWLCDQNFIKMMLYLNKHTVTSASYVPTYKTSAPSVNNRCTEIPIKAFSYEWLQNASRFIEYFSQHPFENCTYTVSQLECLHQNLSAFPTAPPQGVKTYIFSGNKDISKTRDHYFAHLSTLETLLLDENNLKRIPFGLPISLFELSLKSNNITEISARDAEVFSSLVHLRYLFLEENKIKTMEASKLTTMTNLKWIGLDLNPLVCDCSLESFIIWYNEKFVRRNRENKLIRYAKCEEPEELRWQDVRMVFGYYRYKLNCVPFHCMRASPETLNCTGHIFYQTAEKDMFFHDPFEIGRLPNIPVNSLWKKVVLDSLQIPDDQVRLNHLRALIHVDLSNNSLTKWPLAGLPSKVEVLVLYKNKIAVLPTTEEINEALPNLRMVDLRKNAITTLDKAEVAMITSLNAIYLQGNPFQCNCSLRHFIEWIQTNENISNIHSVPAENSSSIAQKRDHYLCTIPQSLRGVELSKLHENQFCKTFHAEIIGGVAGGLVFIIGCVIAVSIYLQQKRLKREKKEILRGFKELLQQEAMYSFVDIETGISQKTFTYDAFISSTTDADSTFLDQLLKELEDERGYKLCISERDFAPGAGIADNIVKCIGESRHIILILSKSFVSSPWCQYEIQVALAELHQRQTKLLIPISIEDDIVSDQHLAGGLKSLLTLVPVITAPNSRSSTKEWQNFWTMIISKIPKYRN